MREADFSTVKCNYHEAKKNILKYVNILMVSIKVIRDIKSK